MTETMRLQKWIYSTEVIDINSLYLHMNVFGCNKTNDLKSSILQILALRIQIFFTDLG